MDGESLDSHWLGGFVHESMQEDNPSRMDGKKKIKMKEIAKNMKLKWLLRYIEIEVDDIEMCESESVIFVCMD